MPIKPTVKRELYWWKVTLPIKIFLHTCFLAEIFTDASLLGWSACSDKWRGQFNVELELSMSPGQFTSHKWIRDKVSPFDPTLVNCRPVTGFFSTIYKWTGVFGSYLVLQSFANNEHNCEILIRCDITTAFECANRTEGIYSKKFVEITNYLGYSYEKGSVGICSDLFNL